MWTKSLSTPNPYTNQWPYTGLLITVSSSNSSHVLILILYCVILILILYCTTTYYYVLLHWRCMYTVRLICAIKFYLLTYLLTCIRTNWTIVLRSQYYVKVTRNSRPDHVYIISSHMHKCIYKTVIHSQNILKIHMIQTTTSSYANFHVTVSA